VPAGATDAVFMRFADNTLWEWVATTGFTYIDTNVIGIAAVADSFWDQVFIVYNNRELFEYVGSPPVGTAGFWLVSPNISP
jgi:hypothetical protein